MKEYYGQPSPKGCSVIIITIVIFVGFGILWLMSPLFAAIAKYQLEICVVITFLLLGLLIFLNSLDRKNSPNTNTDNTTSDQINNNYSGTKDKKTIESNHSINVVQPEPTKKCSENKTDYCDRTVNPLKNKREKGSYVEELLSTKITDKEWNDSIVDEFGARYDKNYARLIQGPSSSIRSYKVHNGTKVICDKAFSDVFEVNNLEDVFLPETIVKIGFAAFMNCKKLKKINLPFSLKEIGKDAFNDCISIDNIILPEYLEDIGSGAFSGCVCKFDCKSTKFHFKVNLLLSSDLRKLYHCRANAQYVIIPNTVERIDNCAFASCRCLIGVEIPPSVLSIGDHAFDGCIKLNNVLFCSNLQNIGFGAFAECESLTQILLPNSVSFIDDLAFTKCHNLCAVLFPDKLVKLGQNVFDRQQSLPCIFVPNTYYSEYKDQLSGYNNCIFKDNSCFSLSAFESFFGVSRIIWKDSSYALLFKASFIVLFEQESNEYLQANTSENNEYNVNTSLIRIIVDREYNNGFKAYFAQLHD